MVMVTTHFSAAHPKLEMLVNIGLRLVKWETIIHLSVNNSTNQWRLGQMEPSGLIHRRCEISSSDRPSNPMRKTVTCPGNTKLLGTRCSLPPQKSRKVLLDSSKKGFDAMSCEVALIAPVELDVVTAPCFSIKRFWLASLSVNATTMILLWTPVGVSIISLMTFWMSVIQVLQYWRWLSAELLKRSHRVNQNIPWQSIENDSALGILGKGIRWVTLRKQAW